MLQKTESILCRALCACKLGRPRCKFISLDLPVCTSICQSHSL